jgi:hypothetical protein
MPSWLSIVLAIVPVLPTLISEIEADIEKIKADPDIASKIKDALDGLEAIGPALVGIVAKLEGKK